MKTRICHVEPSLVKMSFRTILCNEWKSFNSSLRNAMLQQFSGCICPEYNDYVHLAIDFHHL